MIVTVASRATGLAGGLLATDRTMLPPCAFAGVFALSSFQLRRVSRFKASFAGLLSRTLSPTLLVSSMVRENRTSRPVRFGAWRHRVDAAG
jgi:hypothetical protein